MIRQTGKKRARKSGVTMSDRDFVQVLKNQAKGKREHSYRAFYSSFLGGITTAAHHMVIPLDDHMAHRGDAVFEAIKFTSSGIFALERHLDRLEASRKNIHLELPFSRRKLEKVILSTVRASGLDMGLIRLFVSRGEGGFTTNPYEPLTSRVMCAITTLSAPSADKYLDGVHVGISKIAVKEGFFARTKTCNYLPNVLMKKEALDRGLDFTVSLDESGYLAEGSTENFAIFDRSGTFVIPKFDRILRGVTLVRAAELVKQAGINVQQRHIRLSEIETARAAVMLGTTIDVLPIGRMSLPHGVKRWKRPMESVPEVGTLSRLFQDDLAKGPLLRRFALATLAS